MSTIIHGLTKKVIRNKKNAFFKGARGSIAQTEIKIFEANLKPKSGLTDVEGLSSVSLPI